MKQLVSAFILRRLDYCNSVLVGLPWSTIAPLQRVQNARLVMGLSARDHVGPALRELHWRPLAHRIKFKVALLMYMAHNRLCHLYISEMLAPVSNTLPCNGNYVLQAAATIDHTKNKDQVRRQSIFSRWTSHLELYPRVHQSSQQCSNIQTSTQNALFQPS